VLRILANRPVIEIAGPKIESSDNRVFYSLDPAKFNEQNLACFTSNAFFAMDNRPAPVSRTSCSDFASGTRPRFAMH